MHEDERLASFLDEVCGPLFWPPYRRRVRRELSDHILSRAELLERSTGCPRGQAIERAISAMGDAHSLGLLLRRTRFPLRGLFLTASFICCCISVCARKNVSKRHRFMKNEAVPF